MQYATQTLLAATLIAVATPHVQADVITDWNAKAGQIVVDSKLGTPPAMRVMAIVQSAVHEAVSAVGQRPAAQAAAVDAAVAAANRAALAKLLPSQQAAIDAAYQAALAAIADGPARAAGIAAGERAAAAVLSARANDGAAAAEAYRPHTTAGAYVPTVTPAVPHWSQRKPWVMTGAAQFRPGPPPALGSEAWARDYNEVKAIGSKGSPQRSAEQTEIARFWEYSLPPIYNGVVHSVAHLPGRDTVRNARMFAAAAQAMDDALISVFDAKYHHNFWRPVTAIRNGDTDGNDGTARDASWVSFSDSPVHPEYPSGHAILAGAVAAVLKAEIGNGPMPVLTTTSPSAKGATRRWTSVDDFVREVSNARVYEGIHYRFSVDTGAAMGRQIGELAVERLQSMPQ
jgi:hypothetical protein